MPRNIAFRRATAKDLTPLYDCLIGYFAECPMNYPGPVEADVMQWGMAIVTKGIVIVAECDGRIVGSVGMELGTYPWNWAQKYLNGVWLFCTPEFRKGGTGIRLIRRAKEVAIEHNLALRLDEVWAFHPELLGRIKQIEGFVHVGGNHVFIPPS